MFENCMSCDKTFGFLTRKHHCRHCGRLVCKQCQREMQGMTAWAVADGEGGGTDDRASIAPGSGGGRASIGGGGVMRRNSTNAKYDDSIADTR